MLSPAKVVMIDEATANVDAETDNQLQQVSLAIQKIFLPTAGLLGYNKDFQGFVRFFVP